MSRVIEPTYRSAPGTPIALDFDSIEVLRAIERLSRNTNRAIAVHVLILGLFKKLRIDP